LLRFRLRSSEGIFDPPISFKANDYDSNVFEEKDGKIIFYSEKGEYQRKKICGTSDLTPEEVKTLYHNYVQDIEGRSPVNISRDILELLEADLSHVEFSGEKGSTLKVIQRNIYSGGIIEITKASKGGFFLEELKHSFGPVAIKTDDFRALFTFQNILKFSFPHRGKEDFILVKSGDENRRSITGIIACCLYDEIITIQESNKPKTIARRKEL
jgi:hypothetical protein